MSTTRAARGGLAAAAAAAMLAGSGCVVTAEPARQLDALVERQVTRTLAIAPGATLRIENLAGLFTLTRSEGDRVEIVATVHAGGDDEAEAGDLAARIELASESGEEGTVLWATYPVDEYDRFHYPSDSDLPGFLSLFDNSSTSMRFRGQRVRVTRHRRGGAASVWVDFEVRVPSAVNVEVLNAVGRADASGVIGDLSMQVHSGAIRSRDGEGRLVLDTGSGSISVEGHRGAVSADTGSGGVEIRDVRGNVLVDTGSGGVTLIGIDADSVEVDTGSGGVTLERVTGSVGVDTGSGSVRLRDFASGERVAIDTGSGGVRIDGDLSRARQILIDTSSGSVTVNASATPAMTLRLSTGSGGIDVDLPDLVVEEHDRHLFLGRSGSAEAPTEVVIGTGSGGISFRRD